MHLSPKSLTLSAFLWKLVVISGLLSRRQSMILCDFTYGYDSDEFTLAFINVTSVESSSNAVGSARREVGKFGFGRIASVAGLLVQIVHPTSGKPWDACEPIDSSLWPSEPWVAFARYGNCGDAHQLKNIANTNASAAIIYENKPVSRLGKMHTKGKGEKGETRTTSGRRMRFSCAHL